MSKSLKVTNVWPRIYRSGKMIAFADVGFSLDGSSNRHMTWRGFKVFQGEDKLEIALPSRKGKDKEGNVTYPEIIAVWRPKDDPEAVGSRFYEYLRSEIEKETLKKIEEEQTPQPEPDDFATAQDNINDDDIAW